jgi:hypothetical protein
VICFDQFGGVDLICRFPGVVAFGVPLPFEEILELSSPSVTSMTADLLHFIFLLALDEIRWWLGKIGAVSGRFAIGR